MFFATTLHSEDIRRVSQWRNTKKFSSGETRKRTAQVGGHTVTGAQSSVPLPLSSPKKASPPKFKYEALEISEVEGL